MKQYLIITTTGEPETTLSVFRFFSLGNKCQILDVFKPIRPTPMKQRLTAFDELTEQLLSKENQEEKEKKKPILEHLRTSLIENRVFSVGFFFPEQVMNHLIIDGMQKQFERMRL